MKLENVMIHSVLCYPSLYNNRIAILDHLFFTIGGGYEVNKRGELYYLYEKIPTDEVKLMECARRSKQESLEFSQRLNERIGKEYVDKTPDEWYTLEHARRVCETMPDEDDVPHFYPICERYSYVFTINKMGIKNSFYYGAKELCEYLLKVSKKYSKVDYDKAVEYAEQLSRKGGMYKWICAQEVLDYIERLWNNAELLEKLVWE